MRSSRSLVAAAISLALLARTGVSQTVPVRTNLELMANDHYTRSHNFDMIHQRIVVSHFRWDSTSFAGAVTTTLVARQGGVDSIILDEGALLVNTRITDRAGHTLGASRHGDTLVIRPARSLRLGDTLVFTIVYDGHVASGHGLTFITSGGLPHRPDQIWSQGESQDNHAWFPTYDFPNDKLTWELVATVPRNDMAVSNGRMVSNVVAGNNRTVSWSQETPSASYLVSLVVAPLAVLHDRWGSVPVDYYTYHEDSTRAWALFHVTSDMIGVYSRLTGIKYPWAKYAQTTVADFFGGMENVSATTLVDWLPDSAAYIDRPWYQYILIPHELAHQWFGDYVTTVNWANTWLNEGFAEFMPGQYWNEKLGEQVAQDYYADEYRQYLQIEQRRSMPLASLGSNNIYPKGALVLEMLRHYLGPQRFWASIHAFLAQHAFVTATTEDLRQAVLAATGENLDWFWDEWIYASGHPKLVVTSSYDASHSRLTLQVKQTQVDSFKVDSSGRLFRVPAAFSMPIRIHVGFKGGDAFYPATIGSRDQTIVLDSMKAEPTMVVFDADNQMLKELTFEQPSAALAEMLHREHNLWNLEWAIGQLAHRKADADATFALTQAATHADYYLTRVEAIEALAEFPATTAMGSLASAAKDTSATVRAAALGAMERIGGMEVAAIAGDAFAHDASYQVRAAALITLVRADPSHAHDAVTTALGLPSYQDVIQTAGLRSALQLNDTSLITTIDRSTARLQLAVQALAVFAGRGDLHAASLIAGHLNDERPSIRRWTVAAIASTMTRVDKPAALRLLRANVATIQYADTRAAVDAAIVALAKP